MPAQDEAVFLEVKDLTIWRGDNLLLDSVSFAVKAGTVVQIQGSNGSGKTTLLRAMIGLAEYDEGDILWQGQSVRGVRDEFYNELVYLGHKAGITANLSPFENLLALCPELANQTGSNSQRREQIIEVLTELGIADRIDLPSAALSAGQQRRISLARLRLQNAALWVLDEPLTSLDTGGHRWVKAEIERHVLAGGAVIFTTHQALAFEALPVETVQLIQEA